MSPALPVEQASATDAQIVGTTLERAQGERRGSFAVSAW